MNVNKDMLIELFNLQHDLQVESFEQNFQRMDTGARIAYIKEMKLALEAELQEALNETTWKPWTKRSAAINVTAYVGELVDALHFLMNMFLVIGEDPTHLAKRVFETYLVKHGINADRQANGYDGTDKCPRCGRAYDDPAVGCQRETEVVSRAVSGESAVIGQWCGQHGMFNPASPHTTVKLNISQAEPDTVTP